MERHKDFEIACDILTSPEIAPICEMIAVPGEEPDTFEVRTPDGKLTFGRTSHDGTWAYKVIYEEGQNPLANQNPTAFEPLSVEIDALFPDRGRNHYPNAFESLSALFDDPNAPDIAAVHCAAHNWEDRGGHLGEHGSVDVVQARAPMIFSGRGLRNEGMVDDWIRNVDVAPTLAALLGVAPRRGLTVTGEQQDGLLLGRQDGHIYERVLDRSSRPEHIVFFLLDGTNSNVLYEMATDGQLPNIYELMDTGTTLRYGSLAAFPTVTLANHTTMMTGAYPGHHGILNNAYWDRASAEQIVTNHPATWAMARSWMSPNVETLPEAVIRTWPQAFCACVNEPADRGASYSTFDFFRRGEVPAITAPETIPHANLRFVRPHKNYAWAVTVDHMGIEQACGIWSGSYRGESYPAPRFMWLNFTLPDAAMHLGGPHSGPAASALEECDARIGTLLDTIRMSGMYDKCAFVLSADHGMEKTNPQVQGDWNHALRDAGLAYRDEAFGFIYLGVGAGGS